jgi:hypothetical protein
MFLKKDGGINVVAKKALRNRNVFLTTTIKIRVEDEEEYEDEHENNR